MVSTTNNRNGSHHGNHSLFRHHCVSLSRSDRPGRPHPPKGFTALFNGKDFSGWHGKGIVSPQKWESEGPAGREAQLQMSSEFLRKHWKVDNGELVSGGYSLESGTALTSDKEYGDIELLLEYKSGDTKSAATRLHFRSVDFPMGNSNKEWNRVRLVMVGETRHTIFER